MLLGRRREGGRKRDLGLRCKSVPGNSLCTRQRISDVAMGVHLSKNAAGCCCECNEGASHPVLHVGEEIKKG